MAGETHYGTEEGGSPAHSLDCSNLPADSSPSMDLAHSDLITGLRQRIKELEQLIAGDYDHYLRFGITIREALVLGALAKREVLTSEQMRVLLSRDLSDDTGGFTQNLVIQLMKRLRKKLRLHNIEITTRWGAGYCLTPENKAKL